MILSGHFLTHSFKPDLTFKVYYSLEPACIDGVDIFFLISGWFGINFSMKSLLRMVLIVVCFGLLSMLALVAVGSPIPINDAIHFMAMPIGQSKFWFVMVYVLLMILAPVLNVGLKALDNRQLTILVVMLSVLNMYDCWGGGNYTNVNGYTISQAIWLYILAHWLRRNEAVFGGINRNWYLAAFVVIVGVMSAIIAPFRLYSLLLYNSPPVVISSVALLLYFSQLSFQSSWINRLATAAFGCYLLQDGFFGREFLYEWVRGIRLQFIAWFPQWEAIVLVILTVVALIAAIWAVSHLMMPLINCLTGFIYNHISCYCKRVVGDPKSH